MLAADSGVVDRETELTVLRQALARALSGRRGVVAICGEPGVGKSTLVEAFMEESSRREGILVGFGQCVEHRGPGEPYLPVLEAIASLADGPDQERIVAELARRAPTWLAELPWLLDADELEGLRRRILGATRDRMLREMIEALEAMSNERPLALVLEDLHWADPSTLDLIGAIARRRRPARLLIAVTYQPADSGAAARPEAGPRPGRARAGCGDPGRPARRGRGRRLPGRPLPGVGGGRAAGAAADRADRAATRCSCASSSTTGSSTAWSRRAAP